MPSATQPSITPPLPPPSTFDILPPLHTLLTRLLLPPTTTSHPQNPPSPNITSPPNTSTPLPSTQTPTDYLSPKNIATATTGTKARIQKARAVVAALPDMDRVVEEQEVEIAELEDEVKRLRGVLRDLGGREGEE